MSICGKSSSKSKSTWIELLVFNFIRKCYENKYKTNIPSSLKYLIILFCQKFISCKLLNFIQEIDFYKLLLNKLGSYIKSFKLLYRGSDNGFSAELYHAACDGEKNKQQIVMIQSQYGNIFGGYQSVALNPPQPILDKISLMEYIPDPKAFLYLLKSEDENINNYCPLLFKIKSNQIHLAISYCILRGPIFGVGYDIYIDDKCNTQRSTDGENFRRNMSTLQTYYLDNNGDEAMVEIEQLCGGNDGDHDGGPSWVEWKFDVVEYEVYQIILDK